MTVLRNTTLKIIKRSRTCRNRMPRHEMDWRDGFRAMLVFSREPKTHSRFALFNQVLVFESHDL
jgi:hypothetical protein